MPIEMTEMQDWVVIHAGGDLDLDLGEELLEEVSQLCAEGSCQIVLDLTDVSGAHASGIGTLVACLRRARAHGGDFRIAGARGELPSALRLRRAHRIFRLHDSVQEAIAASRPSARRLGRLRRGRSDPGVA